MLNHNKSVRKGRNLISALGMIKRGSVIAVALLYVVWPCDWRVYAFAAEPQNASDSEPINFLHSDEVNTFWKQFRHVSLIAPEQLDAISHFPVTIKGTLDDEPQKQCDLEGLQGSWSAILNESIYASVNHGDLEKISLGEFIDRNSKLTPEIVQKSGEKQFRVKNFEFSNINHQWRLVQIYANLEKVACPVAATSTNIPAETSKDDCATAQTQVDLDRCVQQKFEQSQKALSEIIEAYQQRLTPDVMQRFEKSQSAWEQYCKYTCDFRTFKTIGGSAHSMMQTMCTTAKTKARIVELRELSTCRNEDLECPF